MKAVGPSVQCCFVICEPFSVWGLGRKTSYCCCLLVMYVHTVLYNGVAAVFLLKIAIIHVDLQYHFFNLINNTVKPL